MANGPYLQHYFGPGPMHAAFKLKVFTVQGAETFETYGHRVELGHLILYRAEEAENNGVRLDPFAVFAPGGWIGYAINQTEKQSLAPIGFDFRRPESD